MEITIIKNKIMNQDLKNIKIMIEDYCSKNINTSFNKENPQIKLHEATFGAEEIFAATEVMMSTNVTMGNKVLNFENEFSSKFNIKNSIMNNSGSSANLLAVAALCNLEFKNHMHPGDEVIVPALSWSTTVWPLIQHGLVPVIVDINPNTLNIDVDLIEKSITKKTRAIMPVHCYGNPCDLRTLLEICKKNNLFLIEDSCESLGAKYEDKYIGTFGDVGTYSFYFSHHMTTFEGGISISNNDELSEIMRTLRAHGWLREVHNKDTVKKYAKEYPEFDPRFLFSNIGYNLRPTEMAGVVGSIQLKKLDQFVESRRSSADYLKKLFLKYNDLFEIQHETKNAYHSWFGFPITIKEKANFSVNKIRKFFTENKIETRPIICGNISKQPAIKKYNHRVSGDLQYSNNIMNNGFAIACHQSLCAESLDYIEAVLNKFISLNN